MVIFVHILSLYLLLGNNIFSMMSKPLMIFCFSFILLHLYPFEFKFLPISLVNIYNNSRILLSKKCFSHKTNF